MSEGIDRSSVFRQRRFLLAITVAICAFHYLHATFVHEFSAAFIKFQYAANRLEIGIALWLTWSWALIRYFQYERTYRNDALIKHRERVTTAVCVGATTAVLQKATAEGMYEARGFGRHHIVEVFSPLEGVLLPFIDATGWSFPKLTLRGREPGRDWQWLQDGANCSFSTEEAEALERQIERELLLKYPHFTDFKIPYAVALLAPLVAVVDACRSLI